MSDEKDFDESEYESLDDFSGSEDDWKPNNETKDSAASSEEEVEEDEDDDDFQTPPPKKKSKSSTSSSRTKISQSVKKPKTPKVRKIPQNVSLRAKLYKKYKPPPKTLVVPKLIAKTSNADDSDSGSSVDNCLVDPENIDLQSSFFDVNKSGNSDKVSEIQEPVFDCTGGLNIPDNSDSENDEMDEVSNDNLDKTNESVFKKFFDYNKDIENAQRQVKNIKSKASIEKNIDVSQLLAMGESTNKKLATTSSSNKNSKITEHSDSDWEEVAEQQILQTTSKEGDLQVTVALPQHKRREIKKPSDEQASLMRQLNRMIKENHIIYHKVSLLCHIAHGNYLNRALNNPTLMGTALELLPSTKCYPNGRTEIKYFESFVKWYKSTVQLKNDDMHSKLKKKPPIPISLGIQMKSKEAICKKDFILIFIVLLRAMGMQCRLVMNLVTLPLKPMQSDLCTIKMKPSSGDNNKATKKSDASSKSISTKKVDRVDSKNVKKVQTATRSEKSSKKLELLISPRKTRKMSNREQENNLKETSDKKDNSKTTSSKKEDNKMSNTLNEKLDKVNLKKLKMNPEKEVDGKPKKENDIKPKSVAEKAKEADQNSKSNNMKDNTKSKLLKENKAETSSIKLTKRQEEMNPNSTVGTKIIPKVKITKVTEEDNKQIPSTSTKRSPSPKFHISPYFTNKSGNNESFIEEKFEAKTKKATTNKTQKRSPSPKFHISSYFTNKSGNNESFIEEKFEAKTKKTITNKTQKRSPSPKSRISPYFNQSKNSVQPSSTVNNITSVKTRNTRAETAKKMLTVPQMDGGNDSIKRSATKKETDIISDSDSDEVFQISPPKKSRNSSTANLEHKSINRIKRDRRVLSTDDENINEKKPAKNSVNIWIEVWSELEEKWVTIDLFKSKVHCIESIRKSATAPISYVFAWNNDNSLKDVSPRYCPQWNTVTRKNRVEKEWLHEAISGFLGKKNVRDKAEDRELDKIHLDKPLPTTITEYKNHPLYALERHLLKFEAIYPPNAVTLGFVRGEPVYPRDCVHTLHSREIWLKAARVVKPSQQPYKIVKARPKWDKINREVVKDLPLEIFGYWQTMEYEPPTAENGIVPRNAYGNVELFKECMLPKKTVHLRLPGLNRICKKLRIDCAPAVIGFDFHQGSCHPLLDGFVVCEEYHDQVIEAWEKDQEEMDRKETEKYEQRVYGNWKKLIKGLFIRQRLKARYNFDSVGETSSKTKQKK